MTLPRSLARFSFEAPVFLSGKAAAASALALVGVSLLGIEDLVTAAFVAVLCCSPAVSLGYRQGLSQLVGSLLGGTLGVVALGLGMPALAGVPLAVGLGILATFLLGLHAAVPVAAFTALFVQLVPFGSPAETWATRQAAVVVACLAGALVNVVVSAAFYPSVFRKRLQRVEGYLDRLLAVAEAQPSAVAPGFRVLEALSDELRSARRELELRRAPATAALLARCEAWVEARVAVLHYVYGLGLRLDEERELDPVLVTAWVRWVRHPEGAPPPPGHAALGTLPARLTSVVGRLGPIP